MTPYNEPLRMNFEMVFVTMVTVHMRRTRDAPAFAPQHFLGDVALSPPPKKYIREKLEIPSTYNPSYNLRKI